MITKKIGRATRMGLLSFCFITAVDANSFQPNIPANTVIIPATAFLEEIPKGDIIADATTLGVPWVFNNTALVLKSLSNIMTRVVIPEDGTYYLFVRSAGENESSFQVAVNDRVTESIFGNEKLSWKPGGSFTLKAGKADVKITRIHPGSTVDVLVLSKNSSLKEEDIIGVQFNTNVKLLKTYTIPLCNAVNSVM
jgi:hypothetical protein